jgi:hypothetical protein
MKIVTFMLLMSLACIAFADEFQLRLQAGREALQTREGKKYESSLSPIIVRAIGECVPIGPPTHTGAFSLVGNIAPDGTISSIEVQPSAPASRCFADKISKATLPTPPVPHEGKMFPLSIDREIIP